MSDSKLRELVNRLLDAEVMSERFHDVLVELRKEAILAEREQPPMADERYRGPRGKLTKLLAQPSAAAPTPIEVFNEASPGTFKPKEVVIGPAAPVASTQEQIAHVKQSQETWLRRLCDLLTEAKMVPVINDTAQQPDGELDSQGRPWPICPYCKVDLRTLNPMANLVPHWNGSCVNAAGRAARESEK